MNRQPPENMSEFRLLPAEDNSLPFVPQIKWSMETCWPGTKFSAFSTPAQSFIAVAILVGAGHWCCFPYWHAAHLGGLTIRQAAVWSDRCNSLQLRLQFAWRTGSCGMTGVRGGGATLITPSQLQSNWDYSHEQCLEWCWELQLPLECLSCGVHQR